MPLAREADLVALARQQRLENLAHDLLVVDDENGSRCAAWQFTLFAERLAPDAAGRAASGNCSRKRVPCSSTLVAGDRATVLLDDTVRDRQAEPRALPIALVVKNGS